MAKQKPRKTTEIPPDEQRPQLEDQAAEVSPETSSVEESEGGVGGGMAVAEPPEAAIERLEGEVDELKERLLRTAAEYENFRKRTAREREEIRARAQGEVVSRILDSLDDLGRVAHIDAGSTKLDDVLEGVELVERKLLRELETAGLQRVGEPGEPFDPNHHEAIGMVPAESPEQDHVVHDVLQTGYMFGGGLLRPARVRVSQWTGEPPETPPADSEA